MLPGRTPHWSRRLWPLLVSASAKHLLGHVQTVGLASRSNPAGRGRSTSIPPPEPRSSTTSPGCNSARAVGCRTPARPRPRSRAARRARRRRTARRRRHRPLQVWCPRTARGWSAATGGRGGRRRVAGAHGVMIRSESLIVIGSPSGYRWGGEVGRDADRRGNGLTAQRVDVAPPHRRDRDQPGVAQGLEVVADQWLRESGRRHQLDHGRVAVGDGKQDRQAVLVRQRLEHRVLSRGHVRLVQ